MVRGDWAKAQIERVEAPQRARQAEAAKRAKRRAKFDGKAEYRVNRRWLRDEYLWEVRAKRWE